MILRTCYHPAFPAQNCSKMLISHFPLSPTYLPHTHWPPQRKLTRNFAITVVIKEETNYEGEREAGGRNFPRSDQNRPGANIEPPLVVMYEFSRALSVAIYHGFIRASNNYQRDLFGFIQWYLLAFV